MQVVIITWIIMLVSDYLHISYSLYINLYLWICNVTKSYISTVFLGNSNLIGVSPTKLHKNKVLCEKHFRWKDILPSGRLLRGSIPIRYGTEQETKCNSGQANSELASPVVTMPSLHKVYPGKDSYHICTCSRFVENEQVLTYVSSTLLSLCADYGVCETYCI